MSPRRTPLQDAREALADAADSLETVSQWRPEWSATAQPSDDPERLRLWAASRARAARQALADLDELAPPDVEWVLTEAGRAYLAEHDATHAATAEQPPPAPNAGPAIWPLVRQDMQARDDLGRKRYGTPLQPWNGRDALRDLYEELLDAAVYARQAIYERDGR